MLNQYTAVNSNQPTYDDDVNMFRVLPSYGDG